MLKFGAYDALVSVSGPSVWNTLPAGLRDLTLSCHVERLFFFFKKIVVCFLVTLTLKRS